MKRAPFGVAILIAVLSAGIFMVATGRVPIGLRAQQPEPALGAAPSDQ